MLPGMRRFDVLLFDLVGVLMEVVDRLYGGYDEGAGGGMRGGKQRTIFTEGDTHPDRAFPMMTKLERAALGSRRKKHAPPGLHGQHPAAVAEGGADP
jgi:hypothetical protein